NCNGRYSTTGLRTDWPAGGTYNPYAPATVTGEKASFPLGNVVDTFMLTSNLQWIGDNATLSLITGVVNTNQDYALDFADGRGLPSLLVPNPVVHGYPSGGFTIANQGAFDSFTQEVKLVGKLWDGRIQYVVGGYFFHENNTSDFADIFNLGPIFGIPGNIGLPAVLADRTLRNTTDASAGYGQFDFSATDKLTLTAGVRYTTETKTFSISDNRAQCKVAAPPLTCLSDANLIANGVAIPTEQTTNKWTPKFVATWQQDSALMFYASATSGFKSGGWNARGTTNATLLPFEPENAWSYELGMKSQWLDDRLRVNLTGFYLDVSDLQTPSAAVSPTGAVSFITQNFADYENKGFELEVTGRPLENLSVYTSIGFQSDNYSIDSNAPDFSIYGVKSVPRQQRDCQLQLSQGKIPLGSGASNASDCGVGIIDANGNIAEPVRTPAWSIAVGGTYNFPIPTAGIVISPTVNIVYHSSLETGTSNATIFTGGVTSSFNGQVYPTNPFGGDVITGSYTGAYTLVNAQLALTTDDNNWLVAIECDNCFNEAYGQSSLVNFTYFNAPMTWTIRAKRTF
ncbi:MAG: TonB-dependent receptor, partial [Polymorphobacter sp.]